MSLAPQNPHRTIKLEMDDGAAKDYAEAETIVRSYVLQILVGADVEASPTRLAALLTAVNAGSRAFLGGVEIMLSSDFTITTPWDRDRSIRDALTTYDTVRFVEHFDVSRPVVVIGNAIWDGAWPVYVTWQGWSGGVAARPQDRLAERDEHELSGVLAGALAVSEAFQWARGYKVAAGRTVGLSLWKPETIWIADAATGPPLTYLPANYWLLGLGHLGQANAWAIGFLPYDDRGVVSVMLQDFDRIEDANEATSLLVRAHERGLKTEVVAGCLAQLGFSVRRTDRRFDACTRRSAEAPVEPQLALAGFDSLTPRQLLDDAGFDLVVDSGIGIGPIEYLGITVRTFPSSRLAREVFTPGPYDDRIARLLAQPAYRAAAREAIRQGHAAGIEDAECGLIEIAGRAAGAAFVGAVASAIAVSEPLRLLHGGTRYEAVSLNLRTPDAVHTRANPVTSPLNTGFVRCAPRP